MARAIGRNIERNERPLARNRTGGFGSAAVALALDAGENGRKRREEAWRMAGLIGAHCGVVTSSAVKTPGTMAGRSAC